MLARKASHEAAPVRSPFPEASHFNSPASAISENLGEFPQLAQRAKIAPTTLSPADVLKLQPVIGNRAIARLLHPSRGQYTNAKTSGVNPNQIQRRVIDEVIYSEYDPNKIYDATKSLIKAGESETEVDTLLLEAENALANLQGLKTDEMVGTQATAQEVVESKNLASIKIKQSVVKAALTKAIADYSKGLESGTYKKYTPNKSSKLKDMQARNEAGRKQSEEIEKTNFTANIKMVTKFADEAISMAKTIKSNVSLLEKESKQKHQAKAEHGKNKKFLEDKRESVLNEAAKYKIQSANDFDKLYAAGEDLAGKKDWLGARDQSQDYVSKLKNVEKRTNSEKSRLAKVKMEFEANRAVFQSEKKAVIKDSQASNVSWDFDPEEAVRKANEFADLEDWDQALSLSEKYLKDLDLMRDKIDVSKALAGLLTEEFKVKGTPIPQFGLISILKLLKDKNPTKDADAIRVLLNTYCAAIGTHSKDFVLIETALRKGKTVVDLNQLTGEIALKEFINKDKPLVEANEIQLANQKLHALDFTNLKWLVDKNRITINKGKRFLMNNITSSHREYLITGTDGVKTTNGKTPGIHVHWTNINVSYGKAHVIRDLPTHVPPNPPENDIPNTPNTVKAKIIAAGTEL